MTVPEVALTSLLINEMNDRSGSRDRYKDFEDTILLELIKNQRDDIALAELYERYRQSLSRFLQRGVYQSKLVDEIYNDVMLTVWRKASNFRGESKVSTWIFAIAYRARINHTRKEHRQTKIISDELGNDIVEATSLALNETLTSAISNLSDAHKTVIELAYFHGYSTQEIATITNCPQNTVKTRLYHARKNLKAILETHLDLQPSE